MKQRKKETHFKTVNNVLVLSVLSAWALPTKGCGLASKARHAHWCEAARAYFNEVRIHAEIMYNTWQKISTACKQTLITWKLKLVQTSIMHALRLLFMIMNKTKNP